MEIKRYLRQSGAKPYYLDSNLDKSFSKLEDLKSYYSINKIKKVRVNSACMPSGKVVKWNEYEVLV